MTRFSLLTVVGATALAMGVVYAPQPLLPLIASAFAITKTEAAALITWSLLPMGLAPLVSGLLMQRVPPRRVIAWSLLLLGLTEIAFGIVQVFDGLAAIRFVQGALVAVLLPAVMTYISLTAERLRRVMSMYVAAAVLGGLLGRLLAGGIASVADWTASFWILGSAALLCAAAAFRMVPAPTQSRKAVQFKRLFAVLKRPLFRQLYGVIFAAFFVFTAVLNFMPFRLDQLDGTLGEAVIALSYSGFVLGIAASLLSDRIVQRLRGDLPAIGVGISLLILALALLVLPSVGLVFAAVGAASAGFFLTHAVLSSFINTHGGSDAGAVNSMYVAIYYLGGTLGSLVPGFVYEQAGWLAFLGLMLAMVGLSAGLLIRVSRRTQAEAVAAEH